MRQRLDRSSAVIFGTSITSAYLSGGTMFFRALVKALVNKGWSVTFVEEHHSWLGVHTDYKEHQSALTVLQYRDADELIALNATHCFLERADLVLKFSGSSISYDRYIDEWVARERITNHWLLVYADMDAPMRMPYIVNHPNFYLHRIVANFDSVWVLLGGNRAADDYRAIGARRVLATPVAIDVTAFEPVAPAPEYEVDLLFVGNPAYGREAGLQRLFFDVAESAPNWKFLLSGADWGGANLPSNTRYLGYVPSKTLPQLYSSARLVLNVTREEMAAYGCAAALRLFEAAACGACIVSDVWLGLGELFVLEEEILTAHDADDVIAHLSTIDREQSRKIGALARARVLREHSADIRVKEFLSLITELQRERG